MNGRAEDLAPLARSKGLVVREFDGETLVYDRERDWAQCLDAVTAAIWRKCDGVTSVAEMAEELSIGPDTVYKALAELSRFSLIEDHVADPSPRKMSRRSMLVKGGVAVAAVPLITTIARPGGAHAAALSFACTCTAGTTCTPSTCPDGTTGLHQGCSGCTPGSGSAVTGCCPNPHGFQGCCGVCNGVPTCGICSANTCQVGGNLSCFGCTG